MDEEKEQQEITPVEEPHIEQEPEETAREKNFYESVIVDTMEGKKQQASQEHQRQYHDCIFIDGKSLDNFVINTGTVNGGIRQSAEGIQEIERTKFRSETDLESFIRDHENTVFVSVLITLTFLKAVPKVYLLEWAELLGAKIYPEANGAEENRKRDVYQPLSEIENLLGTTTKIANCSGRAGKFPVECMTLGDIDLIRKTMELFWNNYVAIRNGILAWLFELSEVGRYREFVFGQIKEALADIACLDLTYTQDTLIPELMAKKGYRESQYLVAIMKKLRESDLYQKNAETLLSYWCQQGDGFLMQAVLSLYDDTLAKSCEKGIRAWFLQVMKQELKSGLELKPEDWNGLGIYKYIFPIESEIPFYILQSNQHLEALYVDALRELFEMCRSNREKRRFGYYFCNLFSQDYIEEGYPEYQSFFMKSVWNIDNRKKMRPLLQYVWRTWDFRSILQRVLSGGYITEYSLGCGTWEQAKVFFRELAFTGRKEDFDCMTGMLDKIRGDEKKLAVTADIKAYLLFKQSN